MDKSDHIRDVYAHFGLAMYLAQCLEQSIFIHLMFFDFFPKNINTFKDPTHWEQEFNKYESQELGKPMGRLIQKMKDAGQPTDEIKAMLSTALLQRNRLAHTYFSEQSFNFMSKDGRDEMISELESIQNQFRATMKIIDSTSEPLAHHYGLTEEIQKKLRDEMLKDHLKAKKHKSSD
ncbi:hypothetical protein [Chromobacterium sp. IIBBL 290-4]|uniref:hypothetical protein n=1 Tax=Chromobacterium sp. IIBBL 290-4 TaxID=2953890 RepID=UPI0020B6B69B|nr:hypothetical protein [Chromobacterium sp. IIBBL 290-4]UTH73176.1 hypothetical protein NKT35_16785 [Chromobacterium sp. IIBBL 290-4]